MSPTSCWTRGEPTGIVELPVEWIRDDAIYFNMDRMGGLRPYTGPDTVLDIFRRELEVAHQEGGLYVLTMHPHHIGHRSRITILEEIIRLAKAMPGVWFATHEEIARWCARRGRSGLAFTARRGHAGADRHGVHRGAGWATPLPAMS